MSKKCNGKGEKMGWIEYLSVKVGLPSDVLSGNMRVEICGRNQMYLHGCRRIIKYSADEMILSTSAALVRVRGKGLFARHITGVPYALRGILSDSTLKKKRRTKSEYLLFFCR